MNLREGHIGVLAGSLKLYRQLRFLILLKKNALFGEDK